MYTYDDLAADIAALAPEERKQSVRVWGENINWGTAAKLKTTHDDFVCDDGECWPLEGNTLDEGEAVSISKGEVFLEAH